MVLLVLLFNFFFILLLFKSVQLVSRIVGLAIGASTEVHLHALVFLQVPVDQEGSSGEKESQAGENIPHLI